MRKIVTKGLYTYMEGLSSGTESTDYVEKKQPLKQHENKVAEGLCVNGHGHEPAIAQNSRPDTAIYRELAFRLKFTAWQRIISQKKLNRRQGQPQL